MTENDAANIRDLANTLLDDLIGKRRADVSQISLSFITTPHGYILPNIIVEFTSHE